MATRKKKSKFDLDAMVIDAQARVQEFINTKFDELQSNIKSEFKQARQKLPVNKTV